MKTKRKLLSVLMTLAMVVSMIPAFGVTGYASEKVSCTGWSCFEGPYYIKSVQVDGRDLSGGLNNLTPGQKVNVMVGTIDHYRCRGVTVYPGGPYVNYGMAYKVHPNVTVNQITVPDSDFYLGLSIESIGYVVEYVNGITTIETEAYDFGSTVTIKSPEELSYFAPGYTFKGWNTDQNLQSDVYAAGSTITAEKSKYPRSGISLFAMWEEASYNTYVENGYANPVTAKKGGTAIFLRRYKTIERIFS